MKHNVNSVIADSGVLPVKIIASYVLETVLRNTNVSVPQTNMQVNIMANTCVLNVQLYVSHVRIITTVKHAKTISLKTCVRSVVWDAKLIAT